jgi:hypothetical protein
MRTSLRFRLLVGTLALVVTSTSTLSPHDDVPDVSSTADFVRQPYQSSKVEFDLTAGC